MLPDGSASSSFETSLALAIESYPKLFCDASNEHRLRAIARHFPVGAVHYFGFESPLGGAPPGVDLAVQLTNRGRRWVEKNGEFWGAADFLNKSRGWESCDGRNVWLEWDAREECDVTEPSIYHTVCKRRLNKRAETDALCAIVPSCSAAFRTCIEAAPASTRFMHVGRMFQRRSEALRLGFSTLTLAEALRFLGDIGVGQHLGSLEPLLRAFAGVCDGFGVQLDCRDGALRLVGIELLYSADPIDRQPQRESRWFPLLERLVAFGYARPEQARLLLAWPSVRKVDTFDDSIGLTFATGLQHIKLVTENGRNVAAKAYFGAAFLPTAGEIQTPENALIAG